MSDKQEKLAFDVDLCQFETSSIGIEVKYNRVRDAIDVIDNRNVLNGTKNRLNALEDYLIVNLKEKYKYISRDYVGGVIRLLADRYAYNPVLEKVRPYKKDPGQAINEILDDVMYIPKTDTLSRLFFRKVMMQAMAMTLKTEYSSIDNSGEYGADGIGVLMGQQGWGKSLIIQRLSLGYGAEITISQFQDEVDLYTKCNGVFVGEIPEIEHSLKPGNKEFFKKWITSPYDVYRKKYGRQDEMHSRTSSFIATCNTENFLQDKTGNRRYWCIKCVKPFNDKRLNNLNDDVILRAFAEAWNELEKNGIQSFRLTKDERFLTENRNIKYMSCSPDLSKLILSLLSLVDQSHFTINDLKNQSNELAGMSSILIGRELTRIPTIKSKRNKGGRFYHVEGSLKDG